MTARLLFLLAPLAILVLAAPAAHAQNSLSLTLELEKSEVGLGEPVYALVTLANRGEEAVDVFADLALESGLLHVEIEAPDGETLPFVPLAIDDVELERATLGPGEEIATVVALFYGGRGWTFGRAGAWKVSAVYAPPGGPRLTAGPATLTVESTAAGRYLLAAEPETASESGKFLLWQQGDHLELAREHLRGLIEKHPESDLASFARLALGLNLAEPFRDFAAGSTRQPRWREALELLAAVDPEDLPASLDLRLFAGRLEGALETDQAARAQEALAAAREVVEERPDLQERLQALLERLPELPEPPRPPDEP